MKRMLLKSSAILLVFASIAQAQTTAYVWDNNEGGLVDQETGLVWSFGPTNIGLGTGSYEYWMTNAGPLYAESAWGYGFTDWRVPTKAEFLDAVSKDVYGDLSFYAAEFGLNEPRKQHYWAADASFKYRGLRKAYWVNLDTGEVGDATTRSAISAIVVRQASGN